MSSELSAPPVLSTPDDHILEIPAADSLPTSSLSDDALRSTYEVVRTATEIRAGGWRRVGLQFPDFMLVDAPRVVEALLEELASQDEREDSAEDGRGYDLVLTKAGRAMRKKMWPVYEARIESLFSRHLSVAEARTIGEALGRATRAARERAPDG